mgnify:CR=1 FL=1
MVFGINKGVDMSNSNLKEWLLTLEYLPVQLRDFHDQKDFFKSMHHLYQDGEGSQDKPNWRDGHIYTIDWFLWFMASRGYTLQKSRKKGVTFSDWPDYRAIMDKEQIPVSELIEMVTK